jgi:hypothetical protein
MAPELLLTETSAAGFIKDDDLKQLVRMLGAQANTPDLLTPLHAHDLH